VTLFTLAKANKLPSFLSSLPPEYLTTWGVWLAPVFVLFTLITHFRRSDGVEDFVRKYIFSTLIFIPMLLTAGDAEFTYWLAVVHLLSTIISINEKREEEERPFHHGIKDLAWLESTKL